MRVNDSLQNFPLRKWPYPAVALLIAAIHVGMYWLGKAVVVRGPQLVPTFPGYGTDLVILLAFGTEYWPVLLAGYFASAVTKEVPWLASGGIALAALARTLIGVWLLRWISGKKKLLGHFEDLLGIVIVAAVPPALSAGLGTVCLIAAGIFSVSRWSAVLGAWWIVDALGVLIVTPVLIVAVRWWAGDRRKPDRWFAAYGGAFMGCAAIASYFVFFHAEASYVLFSVFLFILIAAAWLGPEAARVAAFVIAASAIWATREGVGAFASGTLNGNLQNLILFLIAASVTGMAVGAFRAINNLVLPGAVLLVGWMLSGWLYGSMDRDRAKYDGARLDEVITSVEGRINNRFQTYEKVLWGAAGLIAASDEISPRNWHTYVARLHLLDSDPGATAMAVVQPVRNEELADFAREHQRSEGPAFTIHNLGAAAGAAEPVAEHLVVVCAEPVAVSAKSIGADLSADPIRRVAAQQARDSGTAVLTKSTMLGDRSGEGLQLFVPVYREGAPLATAEERRKALMAWVTVVFRAETVFRSALGDLDGVLSLRAYYGEDAAAGDQFYASDISPRIQRAPERITHLTLGSNTWTMEWRRLRNFPYVSKTPSAWAAGCTALLSLFAAGLVVMLQANKRRATDRLQLIESASTVGTWELDLGAGTVQCSRQLLRLYGIHQEQERLPLEDWLSHVHPEDRDAMRREIVSPRAKRESIDRQYRVMWPDGSVHWLHSKALPVVDEPGQPARLVGVDFDISELKHLQTQLAQAQKLESVGQLAAGVAHEINTPIQYIGDNAKFLEEAFGELIKLSHARAPKSAAGTGGPEEQEFEYLKAEVPDAISQLLEGAGQVARIVRAMKEFSHPGPVEKAAVDINRAVESTILVSKHEWKFVAEVTTDLDPNHPMVPCVAGELNQVILNLIVNAVHAIADVVKDSGRKGRIHITTRQRDSVVEISVADTGTGIPASVQSRVFDPFFTTKPVGKGTGQGLAIAHTVIVQKHKGTLRFQTEPGRGTTFVIELPLVCELEPA